MDLSGKRLKKVLVITFCILIAVLILINIARYIKSLPDTSVVVYPTGIQGSSGQRANIFPTLKPEEVNSELDRIMNSRQPLSPAEKDAVASFGQPLDGHPYISADFEISYSPLLNLFFLRKVTSDPEPAIKEYLKDPVMIKIYQGNDVYKLFVISKGSAEYSRFIFETQYNQAHSKLPQQ